MWTSERTYKEVANKGYKRARTCIVARHRTSARSHPTTNCVTIGRHTLSLSRLSAPTRVHISDRTCSTNISEWPSRTQCVIHWLAPCCLSETPLVRWMYTRCKCYHRSSRAMHVCHHVLHLESDCCKHSTLAYISPVLLNANFFSPNAMRPKRALPSIVAVLDTDFFVCDITCMVRVLCRETL